MSYKDTFITVAIDCPLERSEIPFSKREKKPIHMIQYELLDESPYFYNHEELIFEVFIRKENLSIKTKSEKKELWDKLFSKGHPCLRASALTKKYGFGAHYNENGKIALYAMESNEYKNFLKDESTKKLAALKSKR